MSNSAVKPANKQEGLTATQVKLVNLCDQTWHTYGNFPSIERLALALNLHVDTIKKHLASPETQKALRTRGIDYSFDTKSATSTNNLLTTKQILVANSILDLNDKRSNRQKLEQFGVSTREFTQWSSEPAFSDYLKARAESLFSNADSAAYLGLVNLVQSNDLQAIKLFLEIQGIYRPKVTHEVNVTSMVTQLIEIVQKHVGALPNGSEILQAIAADVETLESFNPTGTARPRSLPAQTTPLPPGRAHPQLGVSAIDARPVGPDKPPESGGISL